MKVLFSVNHPSQYHMFKHLAKMILKDGGSVIFFIQDRDIIEKLVTSDGFPYKYSASKKLRIFFSGKIGIILRGFIGLVQQEINVFLYSITHRIDFMMGCDIAIAHVGFLLRKKVFVFTDDDYCFIKQYSWMAFPFCTHIIASEVVDVHKWNNKKIAYFGTQKSAYLHPQYFSPDPNVLDKYELSGKRFFIIRLVNFSALHDSIHNAYSGLSEHVVEKLIEFLQKKGSVLINVEKGLNSIFKNYSQRIDPKDMHSLMYYADLLIGDSQSMVIEAALLGTPAIRSNKWVIAKEKVSVIEYLEKKYSLFFSIAPNDDEKILQMVQKLIDPSIKSEWEEKRKTFFSENTNLTDFLFWIITDYKTNIKQIENNKEIIKEFSRL